jgi:hypothetical protein
MMPPRLTVVGDLERPDHSHLPADAVCYFWGEYTPSKDIEGPSWNYSPTNQLVSNFKKKLDRRHHLDWRYKLAAIQEIGIAFAGFWDWQALRQQRVALVPIPPSKARDDALYDSRMLQMLTALQARTGLPLDIRDCLSFSGIYGASHESEDRPTPPQLYSALSFDDAAGRPNSPPGAILVFDDMLTTGAHFVAASRKLREVFPGVEIIGQFVARRRVLDSFAEADD